MGILKAAILKAARSVPRTRQKPAVRNLSKINKEPQGGATRSEEEFGGDLPSISVGTESPARMGGRSYRWTADLGQAECVGSGARHRQKQKQQ